MEIEENTEELELELETELQLPVNLKDCDLDSEDLQGAAWDDALDTIEGKNSSELAKWSISWIYGVDNRGQYL